MQQKKIFMLILAVAMCVLLAGCVRPQDREIKVLGQEKNEYAAEEQTDSSDEKDAEPMPTETVAESAYELFLTSSSEKGEELAYEAADSYQAIYERIYSGGGLYLSENEMAEIISCLAEDGYPAVGTDGNTGMVNSELVTQFLAAAGNGDECLTTIYELCTDAGIICHTLQYHDGGYYVTRTRLAWIDSGNYAFQGDTPTVTYSDTYRITDIYTDGGRLYYNYDIPGNPEGSWHSGHIETLVTLSITSY